MKQLLPKGFIIPLLCVIIIAGPAYSQTAITAANTTYLAASTGTNYSATGAPGSPIAGITYNYNYGTLSGTSNNSRQLNNFVAGGNNYAFVTIPGQYVRIRRVNNAAVTGVRSLRYSEGNITGANVTIANEYNDDMEVFFNGNINFNSGSDNLFANQGDGNGNNNNIERLDVVFPSGVSASDNSKFGFSIFERGDVNVHDPIKVAVVLSIDVSGNPASYSGIISINAANYGTANPIAASNYVIFRRDTTIETRLKASTTVSQGIAGVFLKVSDFGIANNTPIYGYSIIPNDFTGSTSADILNYTNATLYPTNSSSATGSGGIDLVSATGAFQSGSVVNSSISGTVFNDLDGLTNSLVDGTGTNASGIFAMLVNSSGNVVVSVSVAANGTYTFGNVPTGTYTVRISTTPGVIGSPAPAVALPSGWVHTGEGTTAAGDGTPNGITNSFSFSGGNLSNVDFGIEQPPTPSTITAASQVNPGGTSNATVPAATFGGTDLNGGVTASLLISAFPTNATTITINGTTYTSATFPALGVSVPTNASGQPTQAISIDPIDGVVTSVITYFVTDNAGKQSATSGTASLPFTTVTVSGNVFNDVNGLTNSVVDGAGTNGGGINAILVNSSGNVVASTAVAAGGTYSFAGINGGSYTVRISTTAGTVGSPAPAVALPAGYVNTGEGTVAAGDGTVNGITAITVINANITAVNFGIEQTPTPSTLTATSQVNPGGTTSVAIPAATFGATDPSSGTIASIRISTFPANATTITINGTTYTSATFPALGVSVPTNTTGQPTQTISIDPIDGAVTAVITYFATDNAGKESAVSGTASKPFTTVTVSGTVFNDVNGLTNLLIGGTGTNAGGLNAILVDGSGNVAATTAVAAGGSYTFPSVNGGSFTVRISTTAGTTGSPAPAVALPSGWVNTGEGTTAAGDGTVNGITNAFTVTNANMTAVNFGIEQPPVPSALSAASQVNPGGTTSVTVPAATFSGTEFSGGTIASLRISAFPTNATTITINGTTYTSATFPALGVSVPTNTTGQPTQTISVDPTDGAVSAVITYFLTDNAAKQSLASGTASMPFSTVSVSGNVFNDVNGLTNLVVDGTGTNAGGVNAILVNSSGNVVATTAVAPGGTYTFPSVNGGIYTVRISTTAGTVGAAAPAVALPSGWVITGEGTTAAGDGTANGITNTFTVTNTNITAVNFGIEQPPVPSTLSAPSQVNPGGTINSTVPAASFGATEFSGGTIASIRISAFPTNATSITINGITYTAATFPALGVTVPTNTSGQPTQTINVDPVNGAVTAVITYFATDNAGKVSLTSGTASMPFTVTVSGNVFNDVNGLTNSLVDGTGTNAGGLNAILVNSSGNVVATTAVAAGGAYSFNVTAAGAYTVIVSTSTGTVGLPAPAVALPSGWINTGEGTTAAGDGNVNGIINVTVAAANISGVNFGIEQPPTPSTLTATSQVNPDGAISVAVPAATFGGTEFSGGIISSLRISAFPTNATTITINGTSYTSATFPVLGVTVPTNTSGQPTQTISVDPIDGAVTAMITYFLTDNAGKVSLTSGTASMPFFCAIPGLWTGAAGSDWNNPANWCSNSVPVSTTDVVIPTGVPNMPSTSSAVVIRNLDIQTGTTLDISDDLFTINGTVSGTGTFSTSPSSALTITGSATGNAGTLYFTNGSNSIGSLTVNETGAGGFVSIGSPLNIISVLTATNGTINSNDNITLVSNAAGTASVAAIDCNVAVVNGNVTIERYISARRAWRLLGVPVGGSQTIRNAWQEGTSGSLQNPFPGYGTHITGGTAANGFDQTLTNNASIRIWNQTLFSLTATPLAATNLPLNNERGYFLLVRGNRSTDLTTNTPAPTPTVLRTKGPIRTCTQTYPTTQGICNLIGNPYPSAIDFTKLTRTNVPNRFFLWDPYLNSVGGYQTFDFSNAWVPVPGGGSYGNTPNYIIQSGQAFFVQGTIGSGSLIINEDAKIAASNNAVFRPLSSLQKLSITLHTVNSNATTTINDGLLAIFDNAYSEIFDNDDARKMTNVDEIFGLIRDNKLMTIEKRPSITSNDTLFIKTYRLKVKNYQLQIQPVNFDAGILTAYLEDNYLHTSRMIDLTAESTADFTVTSDTASGSSDRFLIVFKPAVVLPVKITSVTAVNNNGTANVLWNIATADGVIKYEVEKSNDAAHFVTAGIVLHSAGKTSYNFADVNTTEGNNYYRIKVTEDNGSIYYSKTVSIIIQPSAPALIVFPNPVSGKELIYEIKHLAKGIYNIALHNQLGQVIFSDKINFTGGNLKQSITSESMLSKGIYRLVISNTKISISQSIHHN